jgi:Protein of unknown function (DUF3592)/Mu transposase, C-terminal
VLVIVGVWVALAGAVAVLAGVTGARRRRRLRGGGHTAWATVVLAPGRSRDQSDGSPQPVAVQFALDDGRIIERLCGQPGRERQQLEPGQKVLIWYDPADPGDVLVYGRDDRRANAAFVAAGLACIAVGASVAVYGG